MDRSRRQTLQAAGGMGAYGALVALGLLDPAEVSAQGFNSAAFQTKTLADTLRALGASVPVESRAITFVNTPEIAENGAVVPVGIRSGLPRTQQIALMVERNPNMLAAVYDLFEGLEPEVAMRIKMSESSAVIALVKADGRYYMARREIGVTLGGCGA